MATYVRNFLKLYVGNLPWTIGHFELKSHFSKFGHVNSAVVIFDRNTGLSRNYGFVIYSNQEGYDSALNECNHKIEGQPVKVQPATENN